VIIALGGGLIDKDQLKMFEDMGEKANAYVMCSRSLVERGWFGQGKQIGLSGRSVSPRLLIAFGISGSVQFMSGAKGAGRLVAVNIDRNAPILQFADVPIVGDLREIAPMVIEKLRTTGS
jgi:electron transfer flavoprotein alpha subunit